MCDGKKESESMPSEKGKLRKFFKTAKKKGMDVVPEPNGRPIFLFFAAKGRNKPVQVFFDKGGCTRQQGTARLQVA